MVKANEWDESSGGEVRRYARWRWKIRILLEEMKEIYRDMMMRRFGMSVVFEIVGLRRKDAEGEGRDLELEVEVVRVFVVSMQ